MYMVYIYAVFRLLGMGEDPRGGAGTADSRRSGNIGWSFAVGGKQGMYVVASVSR